MSTLEEIQEKIKILQNEADTIRKSEFTQALTAIKGMMAKHGIMLSDLRETAQKSGSRSPVAIKYRGPNGETWTGRGMTPVWLKALIEEGQAKTSFAV